VSGDVSLPAGTTPAGGPTRDRIRADIIAARKYLVSVNEALEGADLPLVDFERIADDLYELIRSARLARARAISRAEHSRSSR
jgi:hypothetical protein